MGRIPNRILNRKQDKQFHVKLFSEAIHNLISRQLLEGICQYYKFFSDYYIQKMGNCAKYKPKTEAQKYQIGDIDKFNEEPHDTETFLNKFLPVLDIRPFLRKVKVKNSPKKTIGVRFIIDQFDEIFLPEKSVNDKNSIKWQVEQNFQCNLTEYQLRKKFLTIQLISSGNVLSTLKINMYLIMIGPYHLDFQFPMSIDIRPRISFDFKISQTKLLEVYQMKQYLGEEYAFTIKTIFGSDPKISPFSYTYSVDHHPDEKNPIARWSGQTNKLPEISGPVPFFQFHYATLKYIIYKIDRIQEKQSEKPVAECYISFMKLLSFDSNSSITRDGISFDVKDIELEEKLWYNGKQCGIIRIKISFQIQKHLKQMLVCVRTQKGILKTSPYYQTTNSKFKQINKQLTQLEILSQKLMNEQIQLEKRRNKAVKGGQNISSITGFTKQSYKAIQRCLEQQIKLLSKSAKETKKIYEYSNQQQLLKGQNFLLKVGQRQLRYLSQGGEDLLQDLKWKVLRCVIDRGQFELTFMGFDEKQKSSKQGGYYKRKLQFSLKFQNFTYRLLQLTLKSLVIKPVGEQRKFAEAFCGAAYFMIPQFRQRVLDLITKPQDPEIQEWRGTDFSLQNVNTDFKTYLPGENTFQILFDWQKNFYEKIKSQPNYESNIHILQSIFKEKEWEGRISNRRGAFFAFIRQLIDHITKVSVRIIHSNWKHFPGYIQIIKSLLSEMKRRPVSQYPSSIKVACNSLLNNENLLNIFVTIIFNKTNINNNFDVIKILDLANGFFHSLRKQNKRIPSTFNYTFFYQGLKLVIQNLYSYSTAKALHLIYEQFDLFSYEFRIEVCNYLLGRIFYKLFLHWSFNVRVIFHHLLVVRIHKFFTTQIKSDNLNAQTRIAIRAIMGRYSELLIVLENVKKIKSKRFVPSTENELYKKLRNNLRKKKKILRKGQNKDEIEQNMLNNIPDQNFKEEEKIKQKQESQHIMDRLAQPQLERYDSQVISKNITIALSEAPIKIKDQVIRKKGNQIKANNAKIQQKGEQIKRKTALSMNKPQQVERAILSQEDVKYAISAMKQFSEISNNYLDGLLKNRGDPSLKMEIMLDSSEMKPQELVDVQQW